MSDAPVARPTDMERIKAARKKRQIQLKRWNQYDKQIEKEVAKRTRKGLAAVDRPDGGRRRGVKFAQSIVLLDAASRDDVEEVKRLLTEGVCPDVANEDGLTALHQCCIDNSPVMCQLLLQYGANVNSRDSEFWTPLHAAATCGHSQICKILMEHGADLLAVNADGNMPYDICEDEMSLDYIENEMAKKEITQDQIDETRLIPERTMIQDLARASKQNRSLLSLKNHQGATALHIAAACGYLEVAQFLLQHRVPLDTQDPDGWQAIHIAACWGHIDIIELLVNHGVNIEVSTKNMETVFDICEDEEMQDRLLQIKREAERRDRMPGKVGLVRRKSSSNPRSASIRRSSMREKSLMSWKEAKQEAEMRATAQKRLTEEEQLNTNFPIATPRSPGQVQVEVEDGPIPAPHPSPPPTHKRNSAHRLSGNPEPQSPTGPTPATRMHTPRHAVPVLPNERVDWNSNQGVKVNAGPAPPSGPMNGHMGMTSQAPVEAKPQKNERQPKCCSVM